MAARNTLKNKALRREQRDEDRRRQVKKKLASRVQDASFKEWANELLAKELVEKHRES